MKQYDIFGDINKCHPQIENKAINNNYYGSELNKFAAEQCRKDIVINNIDLIINNYKDNSLKIVESKHSNEKVSTGQRLLLKKLSNLGINTYIVRGDYPYDKAEVYSFQKDKAMVMGKEDLIKFLNR